MTHFATLASPADWSSVGTHGHAVQFYTSDGHLLDLLTRFVGTALVTDDVAVVIATKAHREGLVRRLTSRGLNIAVPRGEGRFIALDADATLARLTVDGRLDHGRFDELVRCTLDPLVAKGERRRIVAFGETVALLWALGQVGSAIQLEQMWNEIAHDFPVTLCCAYPMNGFGTRHAAPFMKICAQHTHVFTTAKAG